MRGLRLLGAVGVVAAVVSATPAAAVVTTFATYTAIGGTNLRLVNSGTAAGRAQDALVYSISTPSSTVPGAVAVNFSFLQPLLAPFVTNVSALWTFNGSVAKNTPLVNLGGTLVQGGFNSSFSIISTSAITVSGPGLITTVYAAGSNLLSGVFTGGSINGQGTSGASFASGSIGSGSISFTSDFLTFDDSTVLDRAQSLTAVSPVFAAGANGALRGFRAVASGQFSADPAPTILAAAAVPEPASWAMLVLGFGIVGVASRSRKRRTVLA